MSCGRSIIGAGRLRAVAGHRNGKEGRRHVVIQMDVVLVGIALLLLLTVWLLPDE